MILAIVAASLLGAVAADVADVVRQDPVFRPMRKKSKRKRRDRRLWSPRVRVVAVVPRVGFNPGEDSEDPPILAYDVDRVALGAGLEAMVGKIPTRIRRLVQLLVERLLEGQIEPYAFDPEDYDAWWGVATEAESGVTDIGGEFPVFSDGRWSVQVEAWCQQCLDCGIGPWSMRQKVYSLRGHTSLEKVPEAPPYGSTEMLEACVYESDLRKAVLEEIPWDPNGPPPGATSWVVDLWLPCRSNSGAYALTQVTVWRTWGRG
jgi:hypothetical protein